MTEPTCAELREEAAELALGILSGPERAAALTHLARCGECRRLVDELSQTADSLVLHLSPEAEPPLGFETRTAAALGLHRPRRWHRIAKTRATLTAATAAVVIVVAALTAALTAATVHAVDHHAPTTDRLTREYVEALRATGGRSMRAAPLETATGTTVGHVFAYAGRQSWVFMAVDNPKAKGTYACVLELANGTTTEVGTFSVHGGKGSWGVDVDAPLDNLRLVRLVRTDSGATVARAAFG